MDFTAHLPDFRKLGAEVVGISRDSPASHEKFAAKHNLKVMLLSDPEGRIAHIWRRVKVDGHADAVLKRLQKLQEI